MNLRPWVPLRWWRVWMTAVWIDSERLARLEGYQGA